MTGYKIALSLARLIGQRLQIHPLMTALMIFAGGTVAREAGLMLVLLILGFEVQRNVYVKLCKNVYVKLCITVPLHLRPILGVVMVAVATLGVLITEPPLRARHRNAMALRRRQASADLVDSPADLLMESGRCCG